MDSYGGITEDTPAEEQSYDNERGDRRNPYLILAMRLIPISKYQPEHHNITDLITLYLAILDGIVTGCSFCSNCFIVLLYTIVSMCFDAYVPDGFAGAYKWLSMCLALIWICLNPLCSFGKYTLLWGAVQLKGWKKIIAWLIFIFLSLLFDFIILCLAIGAPASVGFGQLIEIGEDMKSYFFPIVVFVFILVQISVFIVNVFVNLIICILIIVKILLTMKGMVRDKGV